MVILRSTERHLILILIIDWLMNIGPLKTTILNSSKTQHQCHRTATFKQFPPKKCSICTSATPENGNGEVGGHCLVWFSPLDRLSCELDELIWFFSADYLVWKLEKMEHFLLKILVGNYFMSSSEMAPWKYSLVKIKPDLRLPSKYPTHFKLHQSILQKIFNKSKISNHIANYSGNTVSQLEVILKGRVVFMKEAQVVLH